VLKRGLVLVRGRLRRGSFFSDSDAMSAKVLRALTRLVFAGAKHRERRQGMLGVSGVVARR
jgi:hypothetical protein